MKVSVLNTMHFQIEVSDDIGRVIKLKPFQKEDFTFSSNSLLFRNIRSNKGLKINQFNPQSYLKRHDLKVGKDFNFCYDSSNQHKGNAYIYAIEALSGPIKEYLNNSTYLEKPGPGPDGKAVNIRYFSSMRINQQGKTRVGPHDVFYSHGIADKRYWIGSRIKEFKYAMVPGPAWTKRMKNTGYTGEIFEVGYTKLDPIFKAKKLKKDIKQSDEINVLWLPTHGYCNKNKGRSSFPEFLKHLGELDSRFNFIHSMHPTTKKGENKKQNPTLKEYLNSNVVIIADAGSTLYEAWALDIPVVFPDWICKKDILNQFKNDKDNLEYMIYNKSIGYHAKNIKEMNRMIEKAATNGMKDEEKEFIENIFPKKYHGNSGKRAAKILTDIRNSF